MPRVPKPLVLLWALALVLMLPAAAAWAEQPIWVQVLDKILPMTTTLIKEIFKKDNSTELKGKVKRKDAEDKLVSLSDNVKRDIQPLNAYVLTIVGWRQLMDELNGVGSLPEDGSFRGSLLQIKAYADASEWYSDTQLGSAIDKIESLNGTANKQWELLWKISGDKPMPAYVRSDLSNLKTRFSDLAASIATAKRARDSQSKRSALEKVANHAGEAKIGTDRLLASWDNWLRELGAAFLAYMTKFGARADEKVERENSQRLSATLELQEADKFLRATDQKLATVDSQLKEAKQELTEVEAQVNQPSGIPGIPGRLASAAASVELARDKWTSLQSQESQLKKQREFQAKRVAEAENKLERLHARRTLSAEDVVKALSVEQIGGKEKP